MTQTDKSATLSTNNDQYLFQPVCYNFDSKDSNAMKSANPHSGCRETEVAKTIDTTNQDPSKNQGGTAVLQTDNAVGCDLYNQQLTGDKSMTMSCAASDAHHVPCVIEQHTFRKTARAQHAGEATTFVQTDIANTLNTFDRGDVRANELVVEERVYAIGNGQVNQPMLDDVPGALNCMHDQQAVLIEQRTPIAIDRAFYNQGKNAQYEPQTYEDATVPTVVARGPSAVRYEKPPRYIVRRLTPTECARLQGFPDAHGHPDHKDDFTDEEYAFWLGVRNTHAEINGKKTKNYTKEQMLTWYNKLHNDSSEYKMWGNGIALPCAVFVMQGIAEELEKQNQNKKG